MRAVIQRVTHASVRVDGEVSGAIERGLLVLLGVGQEDGEAQVRTLVDKIVQLRIFEDDAGKMNRSLLDIQGEVLVVSQFTLYADVRKGRRPSFTNAAPPAIAEPLWERFKEAMAAYGLRIAGGIFGAHMQVELLNTRWSIWFIWVRDQRACFCLARANEAQSCIEMRKDSLALRSVSPSSSLCRDIL